ncbi:hypothetical protein PIB30_015551 [Stylosanthes scabra]|uniref:RNase H type-1 domain-containing protein n=1 Tax=Stylosanthes scabra TaxID=79078 RepID=A0ABU6Z3M1_9FABA|nr:hypothetical protein [Stylosanthes scabra]
MAMNLQMNKVLFESDCPNIIQAIKPKGTIAEIDAILEDIWEFSEKIPEVGFIWVPRDSNRLAHELSRLSASGLLSPTWTISPPFSICQLISSEANMSRRRRQGNWMSLTVVCLGVD